MYFTSVYAEQQGVRQRVRRGFAFAVSNAAGTAGRAAQALLAWLLAQVLMINVIVIVPFKASSSGAADFKKKAAKVHLRTRQPR